MLLLVVTLFTLGTCVVAAAGPLIVADWLQRRHRESIARQIEVTDAIHDELGAVVAPLVRRGPGREWQVLIAVPFDRPALVERVVSITHRTLAAHRGEPDRRFRLVLTRQMTA